MGRNERRMLYKMDDSVFNRHSTHSYMRTCRVCTHTYCKQGGGPCVRHKCVWTHAAVVHVSISNVELRWLRLLLAASQFVCSFSICMSQCMCANMHVYVCVCVCCGACMRLAMLFAKEVFFFVFLFLFILVEKRFSSQPAYGEKRATQTVPAKRMKKQNQHDLNG